MTRPAALAPLLLLAACATPAPPAPPALAYGVPIPPVAEYVVGDSARVQIDAGGQSFAVTAAVRERWRMEFASAGEGVRVTATLTDMEGRMTNPLTPAQTADESAVSGPVVFVLDRRGRATIEALPTVTPAVAQFLSGAGVAHTFFPRLPGRGVSAGASWTDTLAYATDESGARTEVRTVTTYTAAGDSLVDGVRYLLVRTTGATEQSSSGKIAGTEFRQDLAGTTAGHFLWDLAGGVLHSGEHRSDLGGSMDVTVSPVPLDVRVRGTVTVRRSPL